MRSGFLIFSFVVFPSTNLFLSLPFSTGPGVSESVGVEAAGLRHHSKVWEGHEGQGSAACRHPETRSPGGRGPRQVGHRLWQERREVKTIKDTQ